MKNQYNKTITACFVGYIVQAVVNNFTPLLFLFFQKSYHVPLSQITLLVTFNFGIQLLVDLLSVGFIDKIGYRASMVIAHVLSAAGLVLLTVNISRQGIRSGTQFRSTGFSLRTTGSPLGSTNYSVVSEQVCCSGLYSPQSSGQSLPG